MRLFVSLCWLLAGCASHTVRCDAHLQPINVTKSASAPPRSSP
jgi:hypothetical protein